MSRQTLTRAERTKLFLKEYYTGNKVYTNTIRIIGGPLVICCGMHLYSEPTRFAIAYGGFCLLYGTYYLLKPLLIVLLRPSLFQDVEFNVFVETDKLELQESGTTSTIPFSSFASIKRHSQYYAVKLPGKMTLFLKSNQLSDTEIDLINKHLTA